MILGSATSRGTTLFGTLVFGGPPLFKFLGPPLHSTPLWRRYHTNNSIDCIHVITHLTIPETPYDADVHLYICSMLQSLANNNLRSAGLRALCGVLLANTTVRKLDLSGELLTFMLIIYTALFSAHISSDWPIYHLLFLTLHLAWTPWNGRVPYQPEVYRPTQYMGICHGHY